MAATAAMTKTMMTTTMFRVRACFTVKLDAIIPYYERDLHIIERIGIYIYRNKDKVVKS